MAVKLLARSTYLMIAMLVAMAGVADGHPMWGIAVDRSGQVYFSDLTTVWRIDSVGSLSVFRSKGDGHVHEITIDADGNILGAENTYDPETKKFFSAIWKMTPDGQSTYIVPLQETPPMGTSIWRDAGGNAYYIGEFPAGSLLLLKRTKDGKVIPLVDREGAVRNFRQTVPYGISPIAFGSDGDLFFVHGANVKRLTRDGKVSTLAEKILKEGSARRGATTTLLGIALDGAGNPIVADYSNRRVFRLALADKRITTLARTDGAWYPTGVATRGEDVYVLEAGHTLSHEPVGTRVRKISADGNVTVVATVDANSAVIAAVTHPTSHNDALVLSRVPAKAEASVRPMYYLLFAVGVLLSVALSITIWKGRRKLDFRKLSYD